MTKKHNVKSYVIVTKNGSVELADNEGGKFKRFWKQLVAYGDWVSPHGSKEPMRLNKPWAEKIAENFKSGVRGFIPVPLGHPKTDAELAERNKGELLDVEARDDGFYGLMEIRDTRTAEQIENETIPDVSVAFDDDYQDKKTGKWVGPTLKHVGLVVNPYLKGMSAFQPALSDSASASTLFSEGNDNDKDNKEKNTMTKIKNERDFEVTLKYTEGGEQKEVKVAPGAEVEVPEDVAEDVTKQVTEAEKPKTEDKKDGGEGGADGKKTTEQEQAEIDRQKAELSEKEAEFNYKTLLSEGKIVPAQKEAFLALGRQGSATIELSDGSKKTVSTLLTELFEKGRKVVALNDEKGGNGGGDGDTKEKIELSDEEKSLGEDFGNTPEEIEEFKKSQK